MAEVPISGYGNYPYGLNQVIIVNAAGTSYTALPASRVLKFGERMKSAELEGDDKICATVALPDAMEWELEHGGISLEAYALMTGRSVVESGTTPTQTNTLTLRSATPVAYFKIYGKALGDGIDDIHVKLPKCKIMDTIEGQLGFGEFQVTKCKGIALDNGTSMAEFVQNETAAALPTT